MSLRTIISAGALTVGLAAALGSAVAAPVLAGSGSVPRFLSMVDHGRYELRPIDRTGGASNAPSICVGNDPRAVSVIQGGKGDCEVYASRDQKNSATLTYSCSAGDQGLTRIRTETRRLMQIESQGFHDGRPFHARYEARYVGGC